MRTEAHGDHNPLFQQTRGVSTASLFCRLNLDRHSVEWVHEKVARDARMLMRRFTLDKLPRKLTGAPACRPVGLLTPIAITWPESRARWCFCRYERGPGGSTLETLKYGYGESSSDEVPSLGIYNLVFITSSSQEIFEFLFLFFINVDCAANIFSRWESVQ